MTELALLVVIATAIVAVALLWRSVGRTPSATRFLEVHELPWTPDSAWLAHTFLWRERWWRLLGAWTGFIVVSGVQLSTRNGSNTIGVPHLAAIVAGSAVGVAWAARPPRRDPGATRLASLAVRTVDDYLPARARTFEVAAAGVLAVATGVVGIVAADRGASAAATTSFVCCAAVVASFVSVRVLQRRVVEAGRPPVHDDLEAADDARRGSTVQSLHHALLAGLACIAIYAVGAANAVAAPVEVRFDGRLVERIEGSGADWNAAPTPEGGVVLWTSEPGRSQRHVTIAPPDSATSGSGTIDPSRWEVSGVAGGSLIAGGSLQAGEWVLPVLLALTAVALVQWSRIRRAPFQPMLRRPGPRRSPPDLATAATAP